MTSIQFIELGLGFVFCGLVNIPVKCACAKRASKCKRSQSLIFWLRNWSHIATRLVLLVLVGATLFKKGQGSVVSNRIAVKFGRIVLQVYTTNTHRLTESHSGCDVTTRKNFKMAAIASAGRLLLLLHASSAASADCPLAHRAHVTFAACATVPDPQYIRACYNTAQTQMMSPDREWC